MLNFDVTQWTPKFLLNDKNGNAIAMAFQTAINTLNSIVDTGVKLITDVSTMPEWRLDELAWEYNILYDYNADIEAKRDWIANAIASYSIYGTPNIIKSYLEATFGEGTVTVEEWQSYSGDPYHFRVIIDAEETEENMAWAQKAVEKTMNVRSVLDEITFVG